MAVPFAAIPDRKLILLLDVLLEGVEVLKLLEIECLEGLLLSELGFLFGRATLLVFALALRHPGIRLSSIRFFRFIYVQTQESDAFFRLMACPLL